ncbi:enolase C-terminal domain-like protein [Microlunatus sp. Gsoil 973]|uniref:enolase C-terminal domain-like protein n=1 Tax=Microlunatus sp. Gsoil 973 TaxID=2672569 RepID=UPI0012B4E35B|nr:enolase C-terminal domain-like protein [Microlunatus sp. Gsoil 973]QGN33115.1 mandelate racemase [Microlunatus sp. Gsoil 973]
MRTIKITAVDIEVVTGAHPEPPEGGRQKQVRPITLYPEHRPPMQQPPADRPAELSSLYLRISTDHGISGYYGPIDYEAAWPILDRYADFLVGQDALAGTIIWDKLERLDRHARHGHLKIAISAIDNALWDLRGKVYEAPVWQLLGGASRDRIPAYVSTLGTSLEPETVAATAAELKAAGFDGQKWFFADGPGDGPDGLSRTVELARAVRQTVGPDFPIMFDAFMGWDLAFARAWIERVRDLRPTWLEEVFLPNRVDAFVELHRSTGQPLSAGEHLYDRPDVLPFLQSGALSILQCDPEWCGGVTELVRICALADSFTVPVIPHGHGLHAALHVVASQSPATCPKVEYLYRIMPNRHHFEKHPLVPEGGSFALPRRPGFGIELDESKITGRELLRR